MSDRTSHTKSEKIQYNKKDIKILKIGYDYYIGYLFGNETHWAILSLPMFIDIDEENEEFTLTDATVLTKENFCVNMLQVQYIANARDEIIEAYFKLTVKIYTTEYDIEENTTLGVIH